MGGSEGSDISFISDSDDEKTARRPEASGVASAGPVGGSTLWEEVDTDELERIAIEVARNAIPPAADAEAAEAAPALRAQAAAPDLDGRDPLGLGLLDQRTLTLASASRSVQQRGSMRAVEGAEASAALRARVLPSSEAFSPGGYLGTVHRNTELSTLASGLQSLREQLSEHMGQLKSLVKENFDRFISSKDTIDDIHGKLQKAEAQAGSADGTSTAEVAATVAGIQADARHAFNALLARQKEAERIRMVLGAIQQYEALVQLPARVRAHVEAGDHEQALSEYRKAQALLQGLGAGGGSIGADGGTSGTAGGGGNMWPRLMNETEKAMTGLAFALEAVLRRPGCGGAEALAAISHMLELRAAGVKTAAELDPIETYMTSQEQAMASRLESLLAAAAAGSSALPGSSMAAAAAAAPQLAGLEEAMLLLLQWLPDFWALAKHDLPALASALQQPQQQPGFSLKNSTRAAERTVSRVLAAFSPGVEGAFKSSAWKDLGPSSLLDAAGSLAEAALELEACACPAEAVSELQSLARQACELSTARLLQRLQRDAGKLADAGTWQAAVDSDASAALVSSVVEQLGSAANMVMRHVERASQLSTLARLGYQPPLQALLLGCLGAVMAALDAVKSAAEESVAAGLQGTGTAAGAFEQRRRLLCCTGIAAAARGQLLPRLARRWAPVLQHQGLGAARAACDTELEKAEQRYVGAYLDVVQAQLDRLAEELVICAAAAPPPAALRSAASQVALLLAAVKGEMIAAGIGAEAVADVLRELEEGCLGGLSTLGDGGSLLAGAIQGMLSGV